MLWQFNLDNAATSAVDVKARLVDAGFLPGTPLFYTVLEDGGVRLWDKYTLHPSVAQISCSPDALTCFVLPSSASLAIISRSGKISTYELGFRRVNLNETIELRSGSVRPIKGSLNQVGNYQAKQRVATRREEAFFQLFRTDGANDKRVVLQPWPLLTLASSAEEYVSHQYLVPRTPYDLAVIETALTGKFTKLSPGECLATFQWIDIRNGEMVSLPEAIYAPEESSRFNWGLGPRLGIELSERPNQIIGWIGSKADSGSGVAEGQPASYFPLCFATREEIPMLSIACKLFSGSGLTSARNWRHYHLTNGSI